MLEFWCEFRPMKRKGIFKPTCFRSSMIASQKLAEIFLLHKFFLYLDNYAYILQYFYIFWSMYPFLKGMCCRKTGCNSQQSTQLTSYFRPILSPKPSVSLNA